MSCGDAQLAVSRGAREPRISRGARRVRRFGEPRGALGRLDDAQLWRLRGEARAREELTLRYLPLARRLAARYRNSAEAFEDLVQVASVALVQAIDRFDPARGTSFESFAIPTILGELKRHFRDTGWSLAVPRRAKELALSVQKTADRMTEDLGRAPEVRELAEYMQLPIEDVLAGLEAAGAHYSASLDVPVPGTERDGATLMETIGGEDDRFTLAETSIVLAAAIRRLPYLERLAFTLRISEELSQSQIAARLECSQMQVSRLLRRAVRRLGEELNRPAVGVQRVREREGGGR